MHSPIPLERFISSHILIVEDNELNIKIIEQCLRKGGYKNIAVAHNGKIALEYVQKNIPDLILLDIMMPIMDGKEFCRQLRMNPNFENTPIIIQTALDDMQQKLETFHVGAADYICKPIHTEELLARIKVHLTQKFLIEDLAEFHQQMNDEMRSASLMQERLLPSNEQIYMLEKSYNLQIAEHYETSSIMGGDCWGIRPLTDSRLAVYMFDFSGHGITAAMNVFRMHTIMQEVMHTGNDPSVFLNTLNHHIHPLLDRSEFATMFYGVIDIVANSLLYACAAAPPIMVFHPNTQHATLLDSQGLPLGVTHDANYKTLTTHFSKGDTLLLFSDCLNETKNEAGAVLSDAEIQSCVINAINDKQPHTANHIKNKLVKLLANHNPDPIRDDLTINVYCRN